MPSRSSRTAAKISRAGHSATRSRQQRFERPSSQIGERTVVRNHAARLARSLRIGSWLAIRRSTSLGYSLRDAITRSTASSRPDGHDPDLVDEPLPAGLEQHGGLDDDRRLPCRLHGARGCGSRFRRRSAAARSRSASSTRRDRRRHARRASAIDRPVAATTREPNASTISCHAGLPARRLSWPTLIGIDRRFAPSSRRIAEAALLPEPMPPVRPIAIARGFEVMIGALRPESPSPSTCETAQRRLDLRFVDRRDQRRDRGLVDRVKSSAEHLSFGAVLPHLG